MIPKRVFFLWTSYKHLRLQEKCLDNNKVDCIKTNLCRKTFCLKVTIHPCMNVNMYCCMSTMIWPAVFCDYFQMPIGGSSSPNQPGFPTSSASSRCGTSLGNSCKSSGRKRNKEGASRAPLVKCTFTTCLSIMYSICADTYCYLSKALGVHLPRFTFSLSCFLKPVQFTSPPHSLN